MRYAARVLLLLVALCLTLACSGKKPPPETAPPVKWLTLGSGKKQTPETALPGTWYPEEAGVSECEKPEYDHSRTNIYYDAKTGWGMGGLEWSCSFPGKITTATGFEGVGTCSGEGMEWTVKGKVDLDNSGQKITVAVHEYPMKDKKKLRSDPETMLRCPE